MHVVDVSSALVGFTAELIVLHEGHEHDASSGGGLEVASVVLALVFLAVVAAGTWYVYERYGQ